MMASSVLPSLDSQVADVARKDFVQLFENESVAESMVRLRSHGSLGERIIYFYVTDEEGKLRGVVPTRRLLLAEPAARLGEIMIRPVISVPHDADLRSVLKKITNQRLLAMPVIDPDGFLVGVVDLSQYSQAAIDMERRETAEELFQLAGIHIDQERAGGFGVLRSRFPWLLCNITSGLVAAVISGFFDGLLEAVVALAFFVPVVLALAESVSMQSVTLGLHTLHFRSQSGLPSNSTTKEMRTGAALGVLAGLVVGGVAFIWLRTPQVGLAVLAGISVGCLAGASIGFAVPRLVHRFEWDPKIASGPIVLALTDLASLSFYFGFAAIVLFR
jgi:magnesium transporter